MHLLHQALAGVAWGTQRLCGWRRCPGSGTQCACKKINPLNDFFFLPTKKGDSQSIPPTRGEASLNSFPASVTVTKLIICVQGMKSLPPRALTGLVNLLAQAWKREREAVIPHHCTLVQLGLEDCLFRGLQAPQAMYMKLCSRKRDRI